MKDLMEIGVEISNGNLKPVGTLGQLVGPKGKVELTAGNLANKESRVFFDCTNEKGTKRIFGSKAVSRMVKNGELKKGQILSLVVNEYELTEGERKGEIGYVVSAPQSQKYVIDGSTKAESVVGTKITDIHELAAW